MRSRPIHLRLVDAPQESMPDDGPGDLALMVTLLALNAVPIAGELLRLGHWSPRVVGFATACAILAGRELWLEVGALVRARRGAAS